MIPHQAESTTRSNQSTLKAELKSELLGPPRRNLRAKYAVVIFGLLMVAAVVVPVITATEASPRLTLVAAGFMISLGFSELLDPEQRRFVIALRFAGVAVAVLGLVLEFF